MHLLKEDYVNISTDVKATVVKLPGEKSLTRRSYATAVVDKVFKDESPGTRQCILDGLIGPRKQPVGAKRGAEVLRALDHIAPEDLVDRTQARPRS